MSPRMMEVGPDFPPNRLLPGEECYFRLPGRMVMVQGAGTPALVFYRDGRLICDCPEAQMKGGECRHTWALRGGLWIRVVMCPRGHGIITHTGDWLPGRGYPPAPIPAATPEASVTVR
jgi:hypothetical protein